MKISNKNLSILCWITWLCFLVFTMIDNSGFFIKNPIGFGETLLTSPFARGMFFDIGILSTLFACWMVFGTNIRSRYVFALLSLFIGSFAILPFLALYFQNKEKSA